ncbi:MAG TPA: hypothetical protein VFT62_01615 [Mycobacteriales bacterium]|nr:hypothetical protein [Mycobacteriales bacterium]
MSGHPTAETAQDLRDWLSRLDGCPPVSRTVLASCTRPTHGEEPGTWFYVEADAREGVARLRCLGCGDVRPVLDSAAHWSFPTAWSCFNCNQSIGEVAFGVHDDNGSASWVVMAVRCVDCGHLQGLADFVVAPTDTDALVASL